MARTVHYAPKGVLPAGPVGPPPPDGWKEKVVKLIPAEVVTFYISVSGIIKATAEPDKAAAWLLGMFLIGLVCTPLYLRVATRSESPGPGLKQYVITTIAFVVWALATSTPLAAIGVSPPPVFSAIILPVFTLIVGAF